MVLFDEIKYYLVNFVSKIFMASCKTPNISENATLNIFEFF